jgi:hypothetical protein
MVLVGLPTVIDYEFILNKPDYTISYNSCQMENNKNTLEYNYIKSQELIETTIQKHQDIKP